MTDFLQVSVILLVAMNAAAIAGRLPQAVATLEPSRRGAITASGVAIGAVLTGLLALTHEGILDGLEVEAESFRVAAGTIAALGGGWRMIAPRRRAPGGGGMASTFAPIAFPLMLTPELAALSVSYAADDGIGTTLAAIGVSGGITAAIAAGLSGRTDAWHEALAAAAARMTGAVLIVVGVGLVVDGVLAI